MPQYLYAWRTVPRFSLDSHIECGLERTEDEAKAQAEKALANPDAITAVVSPLSPTGDGIAAGKPVFALRTLAGNVRWISPPSAD